MSYRDRLQCVFAHAEAETYAVPAFNYTDPWELRAILQAAEVEEAPVLAAASVGAYHVLGIEVMAALGRVAMGQQVGVFCHLDHARRAEECFAAVDAGFASVMIDGSALPLDENIALTRQVVAYAHPRDVFVEGELGHVGGYEDDVAETSAAFVRVEEVARFIEETGVDSLAIGIGNAHGFYKAEPQLDFDRLAEVKCVAPVPLVLHGGTGIPEGDLQRTVRLGIRKVNIGTLLHYTYVRGLRAELESDPFAKDPVGLLCAASESIVEVIRPYFRMCGAYERLSAVSGEIG